MFFHVFASFDIVFLHLIALSMWIKVPFFIINAYDNELTSSLVSPKWIKWIYFFKILSLLKKSLIKYSTAFTSWFVISSIFLIFFTSLSEKSSLNLFNLFSDIFEREPKYLEWFLQRKISQSISITNLVLIRAYSEKTSLSSEILFWYLLSSGEMLLWL